MSFISDDGGQTYNRCHCEYFCEIGGWPSVFMFSQFGATLKSAASTSGEAKVIQNSSISWTQKVDSIMR